MKLSQSTVHTMYTCIHPLQSLLNGCTDFIYITLMYTCIHTMYTCIHPLQSLLNGCTDFIYITLIFVQRK